MPPSWALTIPVRATCRKTAFVNRLVKTLIFYGLVVWLLLSNLKVGDGTSG